MLQEISCPKCGHMLSVAHNSPIASRSCPKCQAPIDVPAEKIPGEPGEVRMPDISDSAPHQNGPGKWMGAFYPGVHPVLFRFLFPVLTVSCISAIVVMCLNAHRKGLGWLVFVVFFFFLDMLVVAKIFYWAPWPEPLRLRSFLLIGTLAGLIAVAAVIYLFVVCGFVTASR